MRNGSDIIKELRKGNADSDIGEAINEATERTKVTGKQSQVHIVLTIQPADKEDSDVERVWMIDKVTTKLPDLPQKNTMFFVDPESNDLSQQSPQQSIPGVRSAS